MTTQTANIAPSNPFSTRYVRPGAIPFQFRDDETIKSLLARLSQQNWWGEIIGPHGTGKSTLLAHLLPALSDAGRDPRHYRLRDGRVSLPGWTAMTLGLQARSILVIDGYEQINWWGRWALRRACRQAACGLVVTAHAPIGLPNLYVTEMTRDIADEVLDHLQRTVDPRVHPQDLTERLRLRQGNLREALFDLYDIHERRRGQQE